ncbi:aldehyde dehydrogenase family protein [Streptomyces sp. NPDC007861]|uniref:aldehyde dehydrogenase family protein n=1 Tax=Streptomyces sp. NPDC007861 TaxID=3154893 RepID=UPI0033E62D77
MPISAPPWTRRAQAALRAPGARGALGGNAPAIVLPDAPGDTWSGLAAAATRNAGQSRAAPARVITLRENYETAVERLAEAMHGRLAGRDSARSTTPASRPVTTGSSTRPPPSGASPPASPPVPARTRATGALPGCSPTSPKTTPRGRGGLRPAAHRAAGRRRARGARPRQQRAASPGGQRLDP